MITDAKLLTPRTDDVLAVMSNEDWSAGAQLTRLAHLARQLERELAAEIKARTHIEGDRMELWAKVGHLEQRLADPYAVALVQWALVAAATTCEERATQYGNQQAGYALIGAADAIRALSASDIAAEARPVEQEAVASWLLYFEDVDVRPELFTSEEAARARYEQASIGYNCHLFYAAPVAQSEDAERYRWIRAKESNTAEVMQRKIDEYGVELLYEIELDAAIDAARGTTEKEE